MWVVEANVFIENLFTFEIIVVGVVEVVVVDTVVFGVSG